MSYLRLIDLASLDAGKKRSLLRRSAVPDREVREAAAAICDEVRMGGDKALAELASRFGGGFRRATDAELQTAFEGLDPSLADALAAAAEAIGTFHRLQIPTDVTVETLPGVEVRRCWSPLRRVGAYVPGGRAAYPSTLLMTVVPARIAGVTEVVVASPAAPNGSVDQTLLAAARLARVDELWIMGGAQAVAALAYGTKTIERVEKIVGPGNAWVTAAKLAVLGEVAIDLPAGPSEVLVVADRHADAVLVAVDLLCQAEHGPDSLAVLVTDDPELPAKVDREIEFLLPKLPRQAVLRQALEEHGLAVVAPDRTTALAFAQEYAAEHVTILTENPEDDAKAITSAGSVYIGRWAPESAGDYATGANHVLPTGGLAGAYGPLSVEDFGSYRQEQRIAKQGLINIAPTIARLADAEGLSAHRLAAEIRLERNLI